MKPNLQKSLKYLTPVVLKKYSCNADFCLFKDTLLLNTQSPYGGREEEIRDRKIGRRNGPDILVLHELNSFFILKKGLFNDRPGDSQNRLMFNPTTIIWKKNRGKLTIYTLNYPGIFISIIFLAMFYGLISSVFFSHSLTYFLSFLIFYFIFVLFLHKDHNEQNILIEKVIQSCNQTSREPT